MKKIYLSIIIIVLFSCQNHPKKDFSYNNIERKTYNDSVNSFLKWLLNNDYYVNKLFNDSTIILSDKPTFIDTTAFNYYWEFGKNKFVKVQNYCDVEFLKSIIDFNKNLTLYHGISKRFNILSYDSIKQIANMTSKETSYYLISFPYFSSK
jgi:hypothetical protein